MHTTTSRDGTTIAYDHEGDGDPLILVPGAFSYRRYPGQVKLAGLLAARFTVYSYDRRGRGDSGDTKPYALEREIEDLAALINVAGGHAHVWGLSSGAVLALEAAAAGLPIRRLAVHEPPLVVDPGDRQPPADLLQQAARCRSEELSPHPNPRILAKCAAYYQQQGAQGQRDLTLSHLLQYSLITLAVVIALAAILGWIFSGRALRPVHLITTAARAASEHNLSARVAPTGPRDELRELAETFDEMLGRLQAAFEGQQRFGALLIIARNERGLTVREEVDLATAAEDVLDTAGLGDRRLHARLEPAVIFGDQVLAERLVANLVDNAVRYNIAGGDIWISTRTTAGTSQLTVANTGLVISPADVGRIFQPFHRLSDRTSHDGCGLGLAIVASIAAIHGGTATARPRDDGGLSVMVTIPSVGTPAQGAGSQATERPGIPRPAARQSPKPSCGDPN